MNIYEIKTNSECYYLCAQNTIQALRLYESITGIGLIDFDSDDEITLIPEREWVKCKILDTDSSECDGQQKVLMTFKEYMEKEVIVPEIFCSTNY